MLKFRSYRLQPSVRSGWTALGIALTAAVGTGAVVVDMSGLGSVTEAAAQGQKPEAKPGARAAPSAAAPGEAPASAPVRIETVVYDQWTITCQDRVDGSTKRNCNALLKVVDPNRNQIVFVWMLGRDNDGRMVTLMQTPTGVQVPRGVTLKLGERSPRTLPFASCEPQNCEASAPVDQAMLGELKATSQAVATIYAKDGRGIQFTLPLKGIDKAIGAIQS